MATLFSFMEVVFNEQIFVLNVLHKDGHVLLKG